MSRGLQSNKRPRRASLLPIIYFMGNCIIVKLLYRKNGCKKPFFPFNTTIPIKCIGSKWNPVMFKPMDPLYPLRYHLSGLIQGIASNLKTQPKGVKLGISKIANYNSSWISNRQIIDNRFDGCLSRAFNSPWLPPELQGYKDWTSSDVPRQAVPVHLSKTIHENHDCAFIGGLAPPPLTTLITADP